MAMGDYLKQLRPATDGPGGTVCGRNFAVNSPGGPCAAVIFAVDGPGGPFSGGTSYGMTVLLAACGGVERGQNM